MKSLWCEVWNGGFQLPQILGLNYLIALNYKPRILKLSFLLLLCSINRSFIQLDKIKVVLPSIQRIKINIQVHNRRAGITQRQGTVLPNGVKVAVWDLCQIFQKWKWMVLSCTLLSYWMNLAQKWTSEYTELINLD